MLLHTERYFNGKRDFEIMIKFNVFFFYIKMLNEGKKGSLLFEYLNICIQFWVCLCACARVCARAFYGKASVLKLSISILISCSFDGTRLSCFFICRFFLSWILSPIWTNIFHSKKYEWENKFLRCGLFLVAFLSLHLQILHSLSHTISV